MKALVRAVAPLFVCVCAYAQAAGQAPISDGVATQIRDILRAKAQLTPGQQKQSFELVMAGKRARRESIGAVDGNVMRQVEGTDNTVLVDIGTNAHGSAERAVRAMGGTVVSSFPGEHAIRARVPVMSLDVISAQSGVRSIRAATRARTNVGAVTSQGYVTHTADQANALGFDGSGVKVGVLSDSASPAGVASLIGSGDLPADITVLPGQAGTGSDEGTAMMEIIHDLAPGAKLFFATAFDSAASFANNIRTLRFKYGCSVIVDDVTYFDEGAFQDGPIAQAVNDIVADGALFFSSAANGGNLDSATAGTWEGDFRPASDMPFFDTLEGRRVQVQNFGTADAPKAFNTLTGAGTSGIFLQWSDPLSNSNNDYDLFVLDSTGSVLKGYSANVQTGSQDPMEFVSLGDNCGTARSAGYCPAVGDRIVVVLYSGAARALRVDTLGGRTALATQGSTFGHNAGARTISVAATYWNSAHTGTQPFDGKDNPIEPFSSDGPRRVFYYPNGFPITEGNVLFGTNGGTVIQKPDITAADGVFTHTPGFLPFFGTSAAAPHAAAVAALVKSANPGLTNVQIKQVLLNTALDNMGPGVDPDGGYGVVSALPAVTAASYNP